MGWRFENAGDAGRGREGRGERRGEGGVNHLYAFVSLHSRVACSHVAAAATNPPSVRLEGTHAGMPVDILLPKSHVLVVGRGEVKLRTLEHATM